MQEFYNKVLASFLGLLLMSCLVGYFCIENAFLKISLLPENKSGFPWYVDRDTDVPEGGASSLTINDHQFSLDFTIKLSHQAKYPHATLALGFGENAQKPESIDLSSYDKISFSAKCSTENILTFSLVTFDEKISRPNDFLSYRTPSTFFSCHPQWELVELDLTRLETPQWWFDMFKVDLSNKEYKLDKVSKINIGNSFQSPFDTDSNIQLTEITLTGQNWLYLYLFGIYLVLAGCGFAWWFFRKHSHALVHELKDKIQRDRPLIAYQQLSVETHRDRDRTAILHFMGTQYANPELNLDAVAAATSISRSKINDILKSELGFTFTGYLNKLRLTEAARLLARKDDANIAEIAYSVGYKNVSYFNKVFKEEYNCTPKTFKTVSGKTENTEE